MVKGMKMLRLAVFLGVVLLLYQAGTRQVGVAPSASDEKAVRWTLENTRIAGPKIAKDRVATVDLMADDTDPAPAFDLSETLADDPRLLPGETHLEGDGEAWRVAVPKLSLRAGPSQLYPELATLGHGETVISAGAGTGDWLWVRTEDASRSGYIAARLLTRKE